jgi:hypothetical protein
MRETKITNTELNWLSALPGSQSTPLTYDQPVVLISNIEFGRYWFGVLPLYIGYLFKTGYYKEPEASPARTSLRFEDEKGGFKVVKVNLPLSDGRLRLFLEGKEYWLEEGLLVPAKEMKEKDYRRRIFYGPRRRCRT